MEIWSGLSCHLRAPKPPVCWTCITVCVELCMFSLFPYGLPQGSQISSHCPKTYAKLPHASMSVEMWVHGALWWIDVPSMVNSLHTVLLGQALDPVQNKNKAVIDYERMSLFPSMFRRPNLNRPPLSVSEYPYPAGGRPKTLHPPIKNTTEQKDTLHCKKMFKN